MSTRSIKRSLTRFITATAMASAVTGGVATVAQASTPARSVVKSSVTLPAGPSTLPPAPGSPITIKGFTAPAGSKLVGDWIITPDGAQVSVGPMSYGDCPNERVCLFEHENYEGRLVQFPYYSKINLPDYGFNDQMTSFVNNLANDVSWFDHVHGTWFNPSHCMQSNSSSPIVSPNDRASAIETWGNNNSC